MRCFPARPRCFVWLPLLLLATSAPAAQPDAEKAYPLSLSLRTLERDLESPEYRRVLATMIPTDLAAEWQRVATPDNYHRFARENGGPDKVNGDPVLQQAYERRKVIATRFLDLMRSAYANKEMQAPFDDPAVLYKALESVDQRGPAAKLETGRIKPILPSEAAAGEWPAFRGPTGQGIVLDPELPADWASGKNVVWKTPLPGRGNSSPAIWGDVIFLTAEVALASPDNEQSPPDRVLLCFERATGTLRWQHAAPAAAAQEKLYWKNTYASATPVTDGERVYAFFGSSGIVCCDFSGAQLWHADLGPFATTHGPGTSPVLYQDLVILIQDQNQGQSVCVALDQRTGKVRWQKERPNNMGWSTPILVRVGERDELIYNGSQEVVSYDPATGKELWKMAGTSQEAIPMIVSGGGLLFSTSGRNGPTMAILPGGSGDVTETHRVWRNERGGPHVTSPAYYEGRLYLVSDTGVLTCLNAVNGETLFQQRLQGRYSASPLVIQNELLLVNEEGVCTRIQAGDTFEQLGEFSLDEFTVATPAVLDGQLFFRTEKHLWCLGKTWK